MPNSTIATIATEDEFNLYSAELEAAIQEQRYRDLNAQLEYNAEVEENEQAKAAKEYDKKLYLEITALKNRIEQYNKANARKNEKKVDAVVTHGLGTGGSIFLGVGIFLKELVNVTTAVLGTFLFPVNFATAGAVNLWDFYKNARDKQAAKRKTRLGANLVNILGLIAAGTITALAVTNPFAFPAIFLGLTVAGLYKNASVLRHTKELLATTKLELRNTNIYINTLKNKISNQGNQGDQENQVILPMKLELTRLEAKSKRLGAQATNLQATHSNLRRETVLSSVSMVAIGLLIAGAALTLAFPPAGAAVTAAGMLLFATTIIIGTLTSPSVKGAAKRLWQKLFGGKEEGVAVAPAPDVAATVAPDVAPAAPAAVDVTPNIATAAPPPAPAASVAPAVAPDAAPAVAPGAAPATPNAAQAEPNVGATEEESVANEDDSGWADAPLLVKKPRERASGNKDGQDKRAAQYASFFKPEEEKKPQEQEELTPNTPTTPTTPVPKKQDK